MAISDLPQEIMIDIFSRLPEISIGKCRCLSKPWRIILSSPQFMKSHLTRKTLTQQNLLLITQSNSIRTIADVSNDAVSRELELRDDWTEVVGSCDGLVLLVNEKNDKFLVNPITLRKAKVPNSPLALKRGESSIMHGFGYDSSIDDYKVVTLSYHDAEIDFEPFMDVYCVKRGVWRRVEKRYNYHYGPLVVVSFSGVFVNGAIHWLATRREWGNRSVIIAFDLVGEVFAQIPSPNVNNYMFTKLAVLGGCLCIVDDRSSNRTDVWIMKEYGLAESWTKFGIDYGYERNVLKPLCWIGDEELVWLTVEETLVVHNLKEGMSYDMVVDGVPAVFVDGCVFVGSLLSPTFSGISELEIVSYELPHEILIEIFLRLPAKSVGKFRCLSKPWCTILSSPQFIRSHLARNTHQKNILVITPSQSINSIATIKNDTISRKLEFADNWIEILGSCDGLVLLLNDEGEKFLVNPITMQQKKVPDSPLALDKWDSLRMHGFGYDRSIDEYKIVILSYYVKGMDYASGVVDSFVDVYYVKRDFWKRVDKSPFTLTFQKSTSGVFLNGAIHWLAISEDLSRPLIAAFDLVREVFDEIPAPSDVNVNFVYFMFFKLAVIGGSLCMFDARRKEETENNETNVWIMREYGLAESWTKFSIDCDYYERYIIVKPLCFTGDEDEIVWMTEKESLVIYDSREESFRNMIVDGFPASVIDGCIFVSSLLSPCYDEVGERKRKNVDIIGSSGD